MQAVTRQQKTGYYVTHADGSAFTDATGHGWFSLTIARETARRIGGWYECGSRTSIKEVVQGYQAPAVTADSPDTLNAEGERLAREERWD